MLSELNLTALINSNDVTGGDPYTHVVFGITPLPGKTEYPFFRYWIVLATMGPLLFNLYAWLMSLYTGEWGEIPTFKREAWITVKGLLLTSPVLAFALKEVFERRMGKMYFAAVDDEGWPSWYTYVVAPILFWLVSDATFYFTHRFWHNKILYDASHYHHHSCRPTTSFAGNAADVFELVLTGYMSALTPALFVPLDGQVYMALTVFSHLWTIYVHNYSAHCIPSWFGAGWVYDAHDHNIHHYYGQKNYNFGLYFRLWDTLLGTYKATVPSSKRLQRKNEPFYNGAKHGGKVDAEELKNR